MKRILSLLLMLSLLVSSCLLFTSCDKTGVKDFDKNAVASLEEAYQNATGDFFVLDRSLGSVLKRTMGCGSLAFELEGDMLEPMTKIGETIYIDAENSKYVSDTVLLADGQEISLRAYLDKSGIALSSPALIGVGTYRFAFSTFSEKFADSTMADLFADGDAEVIADVLETVAEIEELYTAAFTKAEAATDALRNDLLKQLALTNTAGQKTVNGTELSCVVTTMSITNATLRAYLLKSAEAIEDATEKASTVSGYNELMDEIDETCTLAITLTYYTDVKTNKVAAIAFGGSVTPKVDTDDEDSMIAVEIPSALTFEAELLFTENKIALAASFTADGETVGIDLEAVKAVNGNVTTYTLSCDAKTPSATLDLANLTLTYDKGTEALTLTGDVMDDAQTRTSLTLAGTLHIATDAATLTFTSLTFGEETLTFRLSVTATALESIPTLPSDAKDLVDLTEGEWVDLLNSIMEGPLGALFGEMQ